MSTLRSIRRSQAADRIRLLAPMRDEIVGITQERLAHGKRCFVDPQHLRSIGVTDVHAFAHTHGFEAELDLAQGLWQFTLPARIVLLRNLYRISAAFHRFSVSPRIRLSQGPCEAIISGDVRLTAEGIGGSMFPESPKV